MVKSEQRINTQQAKKTSLPAATTFKKKYKGVRMRSWGSWVSEIRAPHQKTRIWLGSYSTPEAAARAYDVALLCLKGSSADLNFPNASPPYIPSDTILSPKSIQRVAASAANSFVNNSSASVPPTLSSSSSVSSPTISDDDVSLMTVGTHASAHDELATMALMDSSWYNLDSLQSPKYVDHIFNTSLFEQPLFDDFLEDQGDLSLWSFC